VEGIVDDARWRQLGSNGRGECHQQTR
jgi:hypothetical protein